MWKAPWRRARDFQLGDMFTHEAIRNPELLLRLTRPMALSPSLGTRVRLRDIARLVEEATQWLRSGGVRPGDRVAIVKTQSLDVSILQQAVAGIGATAAMLWPYTDPKTLRALLTRLDRPFLVTDGLVRDTSLAGVELPELTRAVFTVLGDRQVDVEQHSPAAPDRPLQLPPGVVLIAHSSGTTGVPKLMAFDNPGIGAHTELQVQVANLLRMRGPVAFCLSYFHARMPSALGTALRRNAEILLLDDPDPLAAAELMGQVRPNVVETFPNVFVEWERLADHPGTPFAAVQYFINTFDAIHPRTVERLLNASQRHHPRYLQAYGTTETGPLSIRVHTRRGIGTADARCVGYPIPGFSRNRLAARPGTEDADNRRGEIIVRVRGAALTYLDEPVRRAPGSARNWWSTGDLGQRGRWGCLHLLDRIVDETPELGSNLAYEDLLMQRLPNLNEVLFLPSPSGGPPLPVVCTVGDQPLDAAAWAEAVAGLPPFADPLHVRWNSVPRGSTWKVRRLELRRRLAAGEVERLAFNAPGTGGR
ncbi:AMP-binding protein [Streptantibioticus ferralitis]|uniref:Class I adenylate-forming enzyme family protein n=1 Tax=Streptantibioticus ferralitis TaxID=236510 RepID=A0ABT5Z9C6_9ACTN|nr:class I adenylate-forming enzyme family protein [Streptantibioticus ferralitis]MDF2260437.1 class I adenylate-forming enzyme family protein [Streptantibioticus ferralitis]